MQTLISVGYNVSNRGEHKFMPGRIHEHNGKRVYHRADGGLMFHGRRHSEYSPQKDRAHHTKVRPGKAGYPHAGDGRPKHTGMNRPLKKRGAKKKGRKKTRR